MKDAVRLVLLNGFDRSGTSMMAKVLASHPRVEALIQPFSSTVLHDTQWMGWESDRREPRVEGFVEQLRRGIVNREFLESDWFDEHSTTQHLVPGKLYVIKSTKLHFKVDWWNSTFPKIPFWGAWRDPRAILCSLLRNDYYRSWYGESAFRAVCSFVERDRKVTDELRAAARDACSDLEKMAVILAVRSEVMFRSLPAGRYLRYETILENPNREFRAFLGMFGMDAVGHDFSPALELDHNIVGKPFKIPDLWRQYFSSEQIEQINNVFTAVNVPR